MYLRGIDVSHYQGKVDWLAVAAAGIRFAFAKATEGSNEPDSEFAWNWTRMLDAGVRRGAYHFLRPTTDVAPQVEAFADAVGKLMPEDLPPVLDVEESATAHGDDWDSLDPDARVPKIVAALTQIEELFGRRPIVYVRSGFVDAKLPGAEVLSDYPLWIAHYTTKPLPRLPAVWPTWTFWQHSSKGRLGGIAGAVDLDRFNGSEADLV